MGPFAQTGLLSKLGRKKDCPIKKGLNFVGVSVLNYKKRHETCKTKTQSVPRDRSGSGGGEVGHLKRTPASVPLLCARVLLLVANRDQVSGAVQGTAEKNRGRKMSNSFYTRTRTSPKFDARDGGEIEMNKRSLPASLRGNKEHLLSNGVAGRKKNGHKLRPEREQNTTFRDVRHQKRKAHPGEPPRAGSNQKEEKANHASHKVARKNAIHEAGRGEEGGWYEVRLARIGGWPKPVHQPKQACGQTKKQEKKKPGSRSRWQPPWG